MRPLWFEHLHKQQLEHFQPAMCHVVTTRPVEEATPHLCLMITAAAEADLFSPRRTVPGVGCLVKAWATEAAAASNSSTVSAVATTAAETAATLYCKHMRHVSAYQTSKYMRLTCWKNVRPEYIKSITYVLFNIIRSQYRGITLIKNVGAQELRQYGIFKLSSYV